MGHTIEILKGPARPLRGHHRVTITDRGGGPPWPTATFGPPPARQGHRPHDRPAPLRIKRTDPPDFKELENRIAQVRQQSPTPCRPSASRKPAVCDQEKALLDEKARMETEISPPVWTCSTGRRGSHRRCCPSGPASGCTSSPRRAGQALRMGTSSTRVIGQNDSIRREPGHPPYADRPEGPERPSGSFIFLKPVGRGKTELAKTLAEFLSATKSLTLDMSEYMEKHTVGAGWWVRPRLRRLRGRRPAHRGRAAQAFSVVLFDEIEKAHPDVFNTPCRSWRKGASPTARAARSTRNVLIMTSNPAPRTCAITSASTRPTRRSVRAHEGEVNEALKVHFRPSS